MKRYIKHFLATVLIFLFSSCTEEFLDFVPETQATVASWYRNDQEIRQATASLYGRPWWSYTDVFQWVAGDLLPGDVYHDWDEEGAFFMVSQNEANRHLLDGWRGLFNVVSYANLIIDDMPPVASGYGVSQNVIDAGIAEARFFRAAAYYQLVEYFGDVPIIEKPAAKVAANDLQTPRNTAADVYEFIRRDLVFAAENLPATDVPGRVTSWAAKGMLAKLHVTIGQRKVGNSGFPSTTTDDFAAAAAYAEDVINNSGLQLQNNYEDMFKVQNEHNPEILFAIQCINGGWGFGSSRQARLARNIEITGDGTAWGGGKCVTVDYMRNLADNAEGETDLRKRAIYMENGDYYNYVATEDGGYTYEIVVRDDKDVELYGSTNGLNNLKKYIVGNDKDHGYPITNQDSPMDLYMLRLADVYLLYAEAKLGSGSQLVGGAGYAEYVAVRTRAGLKAPADGNMSYEDLFDERRVEFGLESQSWIDIKRRYYRNSSETLAYLNSRGRAAAYRRILEATTQENDPAGYELVYSDKDQTNPGNIPSPPGAYIGTGSRTGNTNNLSVNSFTDGVMTLPIPVTEVVANPKLADEPVPYEFN
jgi:starch-binding outer membrane protein, SusD/RagB family